MNINEVLDNSHVAVIQATDDLPEAMWDLPVAEGEWSSKDILAHLTSREAVLIDVLKTFQGEQPSPYILRWLEGQDRFDAEAVQSHAYQTAQEIVNEYQDAQLQSSALLAALAADAVTKQDSMPWLKSSMSLADFVQAHADHANKHAHSIMEFREKNKAME
jgi:hypothetical protein